jgi:hypothetical protein
MRNQPLAQVSRVQYGRRACRDRVEIHRLSVGRATALAWAAWSWTPWLVQ